MSLESELHESQTNNSQVQALEQDIGRMEERLQEVNSSLEVARHDLNKERVKNSSMAKHMEVRW